MTGPQYRVLLADAALRRVLLAGAVGKIPVVAIPAVLTLHVVTGLNQGFGLAGAVNSAWMIGAALGAPLQGRWMDRAGVRAVLAIVFLAQAAFWFSAPMIPAGWLIPAAGLGGATCFAAFTIGRLAIAELATEATRQSAYALDAITTEIAYMSGPPLAVLACMHLPSELVLRFVGVAILVGVGIFSFLPARRTPQAATDGRPSIELRRTPILTALSLAATSTLLIASYEVCGLAALKHFDAFSWATVFYVVCGVASLVGGALYGALASPPSALVLVLALAAATAAMGFAPGAIGLCVLIAPAAAMCAPVMAATAADVSRAAPARSRGLAMGLYGSALTAGNAIGFPVAGLLTDLVGPARAFVAVGVMGLAVAAVVCMAGATSTAGGRRRLGARSTPAVGTHEGREP